MKFSIRNGFFAFALGNTWDDEKIPLLYQPATLYGMNKLAQIHGISILLLSIYFEQVYYAKI